MYEQFFGLRERPFDLTPNPRYLCLTPGHREALSTLQYGIARGNGVTLLIGEAGTGKTTLVHAALESQRGKNLFSVYLSNPALTRDEFFEFLAVGFGLCRKAGRSKTRLLFDLTRALVDRRVEGTVVALVIDEAQCLADALLEEVRLLANIESTTEKLLSIVLTGQPELSDRLDQPSLRQLRQRVALRCALLPLDHDQALTYIATRVQVAGGDWTRLFTPDAVELVYEHSAGIPRTISVICDNALITGFAAQQKPVKRDLVLEVCRDFALESPNAKGRRTPSAGAFFDRAVKPVPLSVGRAGPQAADAPIIPTPEGSSGNERSSAPRGPRGFSLLNLQRSE